MNKNITVHMVVRNEEQWVWYGLQSVLPYVAKIIIFDTGSTDRTVEVIKSIKSQKIEFVQKGKVSPAELVALRNEQIRLTRTAWFVLLDGDEVWPEEAIKELQKVLKNTDKDAVVVKAMLPVGDLTHFQPDTAGRYRLLGKVGHFNIRAYRKLSNFSWHGIYPKEAFVDAQRIPIQKKDSRLHLLKHPYWHMRLLKRSKNRKSKIERGIAKKVKLPAVFTINRPTIVPSPWVSHSSIERGIALILTPVLYIKRRLHI